MSDALYNTQILRLAASIPLTDRLERPHMTVVKTSPICGSRVIVDVETDGARITAYGQEVRACALGQAAASLMGRTVVGQRLDDMLAVRDRLEAFLKQGGDPPGGDWAALEIFAPAREHRSRHGSILLSYDALAEAIRRIRAGETLQESA